MTYRIETSSYGSAKSTYKNLAEKAYEDISRSGRESGYAEDNNTQKFEKSIPLNSFPIMKI